MNKKTFILCVCISLISGISGGLISKLFLNQPEAQSERIRNFYADEMATVVSPATLRTWIDNKDTSYILVDLRSSQEYEKEHIKTAVNIPAVSLSKEQILNAFKKLPNDKTIVIHCYSIACTLGRQIGNVLAENNIYVKELTIGWSEWKYYWPLWNPGEDASKGLEYIETGKNTQINSPSVVAPCRIGEFGC